MRGLAVTDIMFEYSSKEGIKNLLYGTTIFRDLSPHRMHDSILFLRRTKFLLHLHIPLGSYHHEIAKSCKNLLF